MSTNRTGQTDRRTDATERVTNAKFAGGKSHRLFKSSKYLPRYREVKIKKYDDDLRSEVRGQKVKVMAESNILTFPWLRL